MIYTYLFQFQCSCFCVHFTLVIYIKDINLNVILWPLVNIRPSDIHMPWPWTSPFPDNESTHVLGWQIMMVLHIWHRIECCGTCYILLELFSMITDAIIRHDAWILTTTGQYLSTCVISSWHMKLFGKSQTKIWPCIYLVTNHWQNMIVMLNTYTKLALINPLDTSQFFNPNVL